METAGLAETHDEESTKLVLTVTELTRHIKSLLEDYIGFVWVVGEVSNLRRPTSGHLYFTLKDAESQIAVVMFKNRNVRLRFRLEDGMAVIAGGLVSVYERRGNYQIIAEELEPRGVGALQLAFEQLKEKLQKEGLFDPEHKKPLPMLPQRIGIVTSPTGAAIRDILNVIQRRFSNVHVLIYPVLVQGEQAAGQIAQGIADVDRLANVDVIIVSRGGGSLEDLWAFNEETVARAIYECETPVISAVGHEIDFTIADFVSDVRAPTPSAAAELVVQERETLAEGIEALEKQLDGYIRQFMDSLRHRVQLYVESYVFQRPTEPLRQLAQRVDELTMREEQAARTIVQHVRARVERVAGAVALLSPSTQISRGWESVQDAFARLKTGCAHRINMLQGELETVVGKLDSLSPLAVLARGYSLAWKLPEEALLKDVRALSRGDAVRLQLHKGSAVLSVDEVHPNGD
jgi:exodeoxyribonuclease VII large subunit